MQATAVNKNNTLTAESICCGVTTNELNKENYNLHKTMQQKEKDETQEGPHQCCS
jgi:hypothetical protein